MTTETQATHTPGPWTISRNIAPVVGSSALHTTIELGSRGLLDIHDTTGAPRLVRNGEASANARLIAAAPELLAALEDIAIQYNAFIISCVKDHVSDREEFLAHHDAHLNNARAAIKLARGE